jgi:DNA-binding NtrC family response regulator
MLTIELALVICKQGEDRDKAVAALVSCGLNPICCSNLQEARTLLAQEPFRMVLCNDALTDGDYRAVLREVRKTDGEVPVIVLAHDPEWESYLMALGLGAFDYICCPPDPNEANKIIWSALEETGAPEHTARLAG